VCEAAKVLTRTVEPLTMMMMMMMNCPEKAIIPSKEFKGFVFLD
jgi:hypothetical protein